MISFLEYVFGEVKDRRLAKPDAMELLRQFQGRKRTRSSAIHPLLHANTSDIDGPRFSSDFTGEERFLADHVINGARMLPGVALLEMARAAVEKATNRKAGGVRLMNVVFARPLVVNEPQAVHVGLFAEETGEIGYEICTEDVVHCQGHAVLVDSADDAPRVDIAALQARCTRRQTASQCYDAFRWMGVQYGAAHRGLQSIAGGVDENGNRFVLARLAIPHVVAETRRKYVLHPSVMDAALQAVIGWEPEEGEASDQPSLPFAIEQVDVFGACPANGFAYMREGANERTFRKLDVYVCDEQGRVSVRLRGVSFRPVAAESKIETLLFRPEWRTEAVIEAGNAADVHYDEHWVVAPQALLGGETLPGVRTVLLPPADGDVAQCAIESVQRVFELIQRILRGKPRHEVLLQVVMPAGIASYAGLSGLLKTAHLENPKLIAQCIEVEPGETDESLVRKLRENGNAPRQQRIRYHLGQRHVSAWAEIMSDAEAKPWKDGGVYLISGGAGGLGLLFAREIAAQARESTIILTGRSPRELESIVGAHVEYQSVDVADRAAVDALIRDIEARFGRLDGVIHAAGVIRDGFLINKTAEDMHAVLMAKIAGAVNLDEATRHLQIDLFVLFSSLAGATGNVGQADYASANAFLDGYARVRNEQHGRTISINWPLWANGGMRVDERTAARMRTSMGLVPLATASGMQAFSRALAANDAQVMVMAGEGARIRTALATPLATAPVSDTPATAVEEVATGALHARAVHDLKKLLASVQKLEIERIESDAPFERYGIDSLRVMQLTSELEKSFGSLSKTLFFEYQSIDALAAYFVEQHRERLVHLIGSSERKPETKLPTPVLPTNGPSRRRSRFGAAIAVRAAQPESATQQDIAIVGMSGRYPQAPDLAAYWENLRSGRDCITEIPKERWDHSLWFDDEKGKFGKSYSKWGGFIEGVDQFDSLFFNISPREAAVMDPQERLFLQCVYETLEDAGYTRETLGRSRGLGLDGNVGVFVGVMYEEYQLLGAQAQTLGQPFALSGNPSLIANRVSYFCNFHGPSIALDTMCSSSLTALHLACQSLQRGECEAAVAGGVNVSIHPNKYLGLAQGQFASSQGRCESFGEGGDGYVPGEGVGAVLLKPLAKAIADGDRIYGVIKATAINHGGKTNGFSVPNPQAQANVIAQALKASGVPARAISYIEAHGTGTKLGDPIEIAGLRKAFSESTQDKQFCAIGSAKSNIGHCESAAGIAGLTKVLLQMKHGMLVPSLHAETLNPHIDFENSPFIVQRELAEWQRPVIDGREHPRIAGLSSFGAGGSNAHVVIEEHVAPLTASITMSPAIVVLSAKSEEQLRQQAQRLIEAIDANGFTDADLTNIAYTLQTGREAMEHRLAMTAQSIAELQQKLRRFVEGERGIEDLFRGEVKRNKDALAFFTADEEMQEAISKWIERGKYAKLLDLWVKGLLFDWNGLHGEVRPRRISLPTYPFAHERHWAPVPQAAKPVATMAAANAVLHPLLHANTSSLSEQRFTSTFTGHEFFLADHVVRGSRVLPGVAYLEMARVAVTVALERSNVAMSLRNVVWSRPFTVNDGAASLHIALFPEVSGEIGYEIYSGEDTIHSQGVAELLPAPRATSVNLAALQARCDGERFAAARIYATHKALGIDYGPAHRGVESIAIGTADDGQRFALAQLSLPAVIGGTHGAYVLHPTLMDSALHASLGLSLGEALPADKPMTWVPFALEQLTVFGACPEKCWAVIREAAGHGANLRKLDIDLCDEQGAVSVEVRGFTARALDGDAHAEASAVLTFAERWEAQPAGTGTASPFGRLVCILSDPERRRLLSDAFESIGAHTELLFVSTVNASLANVAPGAPLLDLRSLESGDAVQDHEGIAALLQTIAADGVDAPRLILAGQYGNALERCYVDSWLGFARSLRHALPATKITVVGGSIADEREWARRLWTELCAETPENVLYEGDHRLVCRLQPTERVNAPAALRQKGTYLITGGAGGLGLLLAKSLAHNYGARLILIGRSPLSDAKRAELDALQSLDAEVLYLQADVCDLPRMREALDEAYTRFGTIHGVVHAAGVESKSAGHDMTAFRQVLAPKIDGTLVLDELLKGRDLDFVCYFSSSSAILGDFGSCDYAIANRFQTAYAHARNQQGNGRTVAINWPLWKEGGMGGGGDAATRAYLQSSGQRALETTEGLELFERLLAEAPAQQLVMAGHPGRIHRLLGIRGQSAPATGVTPKQERQGVENALETRTVVYLKNLLSATLRMPADRIEADAAFEQYGIDSVMVMQLTNDLEKTLGSLPKTLFFEYQTLDALAGYLVGAHRNRLIVLLGLDDRPDEKPAAVSPALSPALPARSRRRARFTSPAQPPQEAARWQDVAIIGMSGRYPQAANLSAYWENLKAGKDCITEIPKERWDLSRYFDLEKGKRGKTYCRWGGFIDGVDQFDPTFFNMSPREAEGMDPQERLFLQCVYETLEDAGYTRAALARHQSLGLDGNVGVFVGVMYEEYQLFGAQAQALGLPFALPGNPATIANRVSYFCNFHGPSMAIDTMCSSSLTAIHLACQSLQRNGCEVAIAGGVNVSIHPNKYLALSQGHFLASEGRCESFGEGGDGFVPGEGVGAVLLKPLAKAVADGDQIYGVIKATAINHGGKTNGYSVPNPNAQANVIVNALKESGIPPRALSYIEAHGTGTKLGDPIEIAGLSKAFAQWTSDKQFCAIGSAKSNIGHCESAAGIAGVTKVLLQMKHGMLAPSLHAETLNPHIDFADSPFFVQRELSDWTRPAIDVDGRTQTYPRIAGVSSFGAGGSNAHVLIEELIAPARDESVVVTSQSPAIVVLSAKSGEQLEQQVRNLLQAIETKSLGASNLVEIAYTLQIGREAMEHRLALTVASIEQLREKLARFLVGETGIENLYRGEAKGNRAILSAFTNDEDLRKAIGSWAAKGKYAKLLDLWVKGLSFDWSTLYAGVVPRRVSLPTYPFAKERYWAIPSPEALTVTPTTTVLHPLLHENTSDLTEQRFSSKFNGEELFLSDHRVQGNRVLPGVAYLEMARAAVARAGNVADDHAVSLKNIVWVQPFAVLDAPATLHIGLIPEESGDIAYEAYSETADGERVIHSQGVAAIVAAPEGALLDLAGLRAQCNGEVPTERLYAMHKAMGIDYGPAHRGVESLATGSDAQGRRFVLAQVSLPAAIAETHSRYVLHPTLLDSALHASLGLMLGGADKPTTWLPFGLEQLNVLGRCPEKLYVFIRDAAGTAGTLRKLDVDLCDGQGNVCVQMRGFAARALEAAVAAEKPAEDFALMTFVERWQEQPVSAAANAPRTVVCLLDGEEYQRAAADALKRIDPQARVIFIASVSDAVSLTDGLRGTGTPDALLYLRPLEDRTAIRDYDAIVALIQAVAAAGLKCPRLILAAEYADDLERCFIDSWLGLTRSLRLVLPETKVTVVATAFAGKGKTKPSSVMHQWMQRLWAELCIDKPESALYESGKRQVLRVHPTERSDAATPFRQGGTYLITGGAGGLGLLVATRLAKKYAANLILTGRSATVASTSAKLAELEALGSNVSYVQADVCNAVQMQSVIQQARERFGAIHGVIHAAGVQNRQGIIGKTASEFHGVLAPKVEGTLALHDALKGEALDFLCHFSSSSAILGDFGSCDYAVANRFQTAHAQYRKQKIKTTVMNWPLWKDGTMSVGDEATTSVYLRASGQRTLESDEGLDLFEQLLGEPAAQQLVMAGYPTRIHRLLGMMPPEALPAVAPVIAAAPLRLPEPQTARNPSNALESKTIHYVKQLLSASLKLPLHRIDADALFETFGIDSVMVLQLTNELEKELGSLSKTLFFEYQSVEALAAHLVAHHREPLSRLFGVDAAPLVEVPFVPLSIPGPVPAHIPAQNARRRSRFARESQAQPKASNYIAIVGMSGRFPQAENVAAFWENLKEGKDCIIEVPPERWDHAAYFDPQRGKVGKSYGKWGGFIEGVDRFDPLFFNISPREAQFMDPQERLFLETVWNLLESSGSTRESLQQQYAGKVGVYVGSMYPQYGFFNSRSAIANRVSYFFGLQGPSITIDTMCSSAAVAIHNACGDLARGDCELAIAGGVNLSTHPQKYVALSQGQLIGSHADSRSFGRGDGYIPAEAVGAVLLKPLGRAIADGDDILAVIKATSINHGGRSNGYSVPNPNAQAQVIEEVIRKADVDPRTISCVEAAATGSALGDPIEVTALNKAFAMTADRGFCAIGSVKSNIGHAEGASGIAQLTKVVLQLQHRQLVPSIKADALNPNLTFDDTAFRLQRDVRAWERPMVEVDGESREAPRRALVNSFGAGGSNACLLIEEYIPAAPQLATPSSEPEVIVVSAKNPDRLAAVVQGLLEHVEAHRELSLTNLAYTLQVGRESMTSRLALVVGGRQELIDGLGAHLTGTEPSIPSFTGELSERSTIKMLTSGKAGEAMMQVLLAERSLEKIALLWTEGSRIPWSSLHDGAARQIVSLPTYPFEREWLPLPDVERAPQRDPDPLFELFGEELRPIAGAAHVMLKANVVLPRTDLERAIVAVWEEALGVSGIGVEDSFLDLGGNSLQGARILMRLQELFSVEVPLQALLGSQPTVAGLAVVIVSELMKLQGVALFEEDLVPMSPA